VSAAGLRSIRRRYHLLLALRFVPIGLGITVIVLLLQSRGLSLAQIGVAVAAQGIVMLFLELPSGGLADAVGRKPVLVVSVVVWMLATGLLVVADTVVLVAIVFALMGVFRALDSGPLEAWFVDASLDADPDADLDSGLAHAGVVISVSIGGGALVGGFLASTSGFAGIDPLVVPLVIGLVVQAVGLVALLLLVHEHRPTTGWTAARESAREVPAVVSGAMRLIRRSRVLGALVFAEFLWGFGMVAFELFFPPRLVEVSSNPSDVTSVLGFSITAGWGLSAVGASCAPWLVGRFGAPVAGCALRLLHGLTVLGMAVAFGPVGLIGAYLATYFVHGASAPVHYGMVHRAVESRHRATVVSANSLTSQLGGALSGIALGALADATSLSTAMTVAAVVLASAAPLYLVGRGGQVAELDPVDLDTVEAAPPLNVA
jgi:MFS family permease